MTAFMTTLPVVFVLLTRPGHRRAKGVQFQSHGTQVWLCFLALSFSSVSTCAVSAADIADLQSCLRKLKHTIEKSDAMVYAPSIDEIQETCKYMTLKCYMLELIMVLDEEEVSRANCILAFNEEFAFNSVDCLPCEAYKLQNITTFLDRLNNLLEKLNAEGNR